MLFSASAYAADTYSFVTQTTNASTLSFLNPITGSQFSGRALGINTRSGATYSADGSVAFVTESNEQTFTEALVAYSVPAGTRLGAITIPKGTFGVATAIPGTANLFVSVDLGQTRSSIYEVNGTNFEAKAVFKTGTGASALAVSPDGGTLYISTYAALLSVSTTTFQQTASVLIAGIDDLAVTPDGSLLILGISDGSENIVAEYDPTTMAVSGSIPADEGAYVAISPDGSSFYTTFTDGSGAPRMLEQVSIATLAIVNSVAIPSIVGTSTGNPLAISPDGKKLAIFAQVTDPEIAFFKLPALTPGPVTPVGNVCGVAFPTAALVSVTNCWADTVGVVDITTGALATRYDAGPSPQSTLTNSSGSVLYVSNPYGVWALATKTGTILSKVEFPGPSTNLINDAQLALSADGTTLFAQYQSGVIEIATSDNELIGNVPGVPTGFNASAIATSPDGKYLFVAGTPANASENPELLLLSQTTGVLIHTVSTVSNGNGVLLVPSKDSANLYYEGIGAGGLSSLYDFNVASRSFGLVAGVFEGTLALVLSPDGMTLYTAAGTVNTINTETFASTAIPSPVPAVGIAITPDGTKLVVTSTDPELGVITIANPLIGETIPIGGATAAISLR